MHKTCAACGTPYTIALTWCPNCGSTQTVEDAQSVSNPQVDVSIAGATESPLAPDVTPLVGESAPENPSVSAMQTPDVPDSTEAGVN